MNHCLKLFIFLFSTDDAVCVELTQFKELFKAHLHGVIRHVITQLHLPLKFKTQLNFFSLTIQNGITLSSRID